MKVTSMPAPGQQQTFTTNNQAAPDTRAKAIAMLETNSSTPEAAIQAKSSKSSQTSQEQSPVRNQNQISVEEMGAVSPQVPKGEAREISDSDNTTQNIESDSPSTPEAPAPVKMSSEEQERRRRFQEKARQERARIIQLRRQEASIKSREALIQAKEEQLAAKEQEYQQSYIPRERLKQDPLSVLAEADVSYDEIANQLLNQTQADPRTQAHIQRLEAKLEKLEQLNDQTRKAAQDQQSQTYQAAIKQIENDVKQLVKIDPNYETIRETKSVSDVVDLIVKTYEKDGVLLSVDEAAQEVENYLVDETLKMTRLGKIQARLKAATQATSQKKEQNRPQQSAQPQQMKTLTNSVSSSRKLTNKERAILAFKGQLNNS